jgi:hypothetical protein
MEYWNTDGKMEYSTIGILEFWNNNKGMWQWSNKVLEY